MLKSQPLHRCLLLLTFVLSTACSTPDLDGLFPAPPTRADASQATRKDLGPISLLDMGVDMSVPPRSIFPNGRALFVDFDMRSSAGWKGVLTALEEAGVTVEYRRWYPHITAEDVDGRYGVMIIASGTGPGDPSPLMRPTSVESVSSFVAAGGSVLFATTHSWADSPRAQNETYRFNQVLEALDVQARIESNTLIGDVFLPEGDAPPLHTSLPWSYVIPLEWSIGLPVAFPGPDIPGRDDLDALALGWSSSISCAGAEVRVLTRAHIDVYSWVRREGDETLSVPSESLPVAVLSPAGYGSIGLVPRSILEMQHHSSVGADQPILEPALFEQTGAMAQGILDAWVDSARAETVVSGEGCFSGQMPLYAPSEHHPPQLLLSVRPVPETPPELRWLRDEERPAAPRHSPPWFRGERGRLGYGDLMNAETMAGVLNRIVTSNMDGLVAHLPAAVLIDYDPASGLAQLLETTAQRAANAQTFLGLAVHYRNALFEEVRDQVGPALGAHGQQLDAPRPLSSRWWDTNLTPLFLGAAQATAALPGSSGMVLDLELYDAGSLIYDDGYIFDDTTWALIAGWVGESDGPLGEECAATVLRDRLAWLVDHGLIAFVYQKLEDQVAERARTTLEAARAINPNFEVILYMHGIQTGWFYRGLMRGLSTNARPIAVLSYDYFTDGVTTALRQEGISIVSLSGVLAVKLRALDAETALYQAGRSSDGNWMFQFGDFPDVEPGVIGPLRHDPIDAYWSAFGRANARLETME